MLKWGIWHFFGALTVSVLNKCYSVATCSSTHSVGCTYWNTSIKFISFIPFIADVISIISGRFEWQSSWCRRHQLQCAPHTLFSIRTFSRSLTHTHHGNPICGMIFSSFFLLLSFFLTDHRIKIIIVVFRSFIFRRHKPAQMFQIHYTKHLLLCDTATFK